jgi:hypothetical protein
MTEQRSRTVKTRVFKNHFPKSDPVSAQAVALGGNPLKRETAVTGREGDRRPGFWGRTAVMFMETVEVDAETMPSFRPIEREGTE